MDFPTGQVGHEPLRTRERAEQRRVGARVIGPALVGGDREQRGLRTVGPAQRERGVGQRLDPLLVARGRRRVAIALGAGRVAAVRRHPRPPPRRAAAPRHPAATADGGSACGRAVRVRSGAPALRRVRTTARRRTRSRVRSGRAEEAARHSSTASRRVPRYSSLSGRPSAAHASALVARCRMTRMPSVSSSSQVWSRGQLRASDSCARPTPSSPLVTSRDWTSWLKHPCRVVVVRQRRHRHVPREDRAVQRDAAPAAASASDTAPGRSPGRLSNRRSAERDTAPDRPPDCSYPATVSVAPSRRCQVSTRACESSGKAPAGPRRRAARGRRDRPRAGGLRAARVRRSPRAVQHHPADERGRARARPRRSGRQPSRGRRAHRRGPPAAPGRHRRRAGTARRHRIRRPPAVSSSSAWSSATTPSGPAASAGRADRPERVDAGQDQLDAVPAAAQLGDEPSAQQRALAAPDGPLSTSTGEDSRRASPSAISRSRPKKFSWSAASNGTRPGIRAGSARRRTRPRRRPATRPGAGSRSRATPAPGRDPRRAARPAAPGPGGSSPARRPDAHRGTARGRAAPSVARAGAPRGRRPRRPRRRPRRRRWRAAPPEQVVLDTAPQLSQTDRRPRSLLPAVEIRERLPAPQVERLGEPAHARSASPSRANLSRPVHECVEARDVQLVRGKVEPVAGADASRCSRGAGRGEAEPPRPGSASATSPADGRPSTHRRSRQGHDDVSGAQRQHREHCPFPGPEARLAVDLRRAEDGDSHGHESLPLRSGGQAPPVPAHTIRIPRPRSAAYQLARQLPGMRPLPPERRARRYPPPSSLPSPRWPSRLQTLGTAPGRPPRCARRTGSVRLPRVSSCLDARKATRRLAAAASSYGRVGLQPCPAEDAWLSCGTVQVPLNRADPRDPRTIGIHVELSLHSAAGSADEESSCSRPAGRARPSPRPSPATSTALLGDLPQTFDIVLIDQRGVGQSEAIDCD